jgi:hypothetical protein
MAALEMWRPDHLIRQAVATASTATFYNSPALGWWRCTQNAPDSDHPPSSASRGRAARR